MCEQKQKQVVSNLILETCERLCIYLDSNSSSFRPELLIAHNGPYFDYEPPIRSASHLAIVYFLSYRLFGVSSHLEIANYLVDLLIDELQKNAPWGIHRIPEHPSRDMTNGCIGIAWVLEALIYSLQVAPREIVKNELRRLLNTIKIEDIKGNIFLDDGRQDIIDLTYNHQLWLLAFYLKAHELLEVVPTENIVCLLDRYLKPTTYPDGIFQHSYRLSDFESTAGRSFSQHLKLLKLYGKSVAYMPFVQLGYKYLLDTCFARDYHCVSDKYLKLDYLFSPINRIFLKHSKYGSRYNPVGFELMVLSQHALESSHRRYIHQLTEYQIRLHKRVIRNLDRLPIDLDSRRLYTRIYEVYPLFR